MFFSSAIRQLVFLVFINAIVSQYNTIHTILIYKSNFRHLREYIIHSFIHLYLSKYAISLTNIFHAGTVACFQRSGTLCESSLNLDLDLHKCNSTRRRPHSSLCNQPKNMFPIKKIKNMLQFCKKDS